MAASTRSRSSASNNGATFVSGSLLRHILTMTGASAVGLMALFIGDLANIYFLSLLGDQQIVAAVSYASSIVVVMTYIGVGLAIATTAVVSPALGAGRRTRARRLGVNAHICTLITAASCAVLISFFVPSLLTLFGAVGRTHDLASAYLHIMLLGLPPVAGGLTLTAILRSAGDARRAMMVTFTGAAANVILDPIFIFTLDLGLHGAAIASVLARVVLYAGGFYFVFRFHKLFARPKLPLLVRDVSPIAAIAIPAVATNMATPTANAYITAVMSDFGDAAVAGWGIIGRIMPVAFGAIFALTSALGPIIGQNYGVQDYGRMQRTLTLSLFVTLVFSVVAWVIMFILAETIARQFNATGESAELIILFCCWLSPLFAFFGALFIANATFNSVGRAYFSTMLNWARATIGTIPFVLVGAHFYGAPGILIGNMAGGIVFGILAVGLCYRLIAKLRNDNEANTTKS